jgi:hypothetical protein
MILQLLIVSFFSPAISTSYQLTAYSTNMLPDKIVNSISDINTPNTHRTGVTEQIALNLNEIPTPPRYVREPDVTISTIEGTMYAHWANGSLITEKADFLTLFEKVVTELPTNAVVLIQEGEYPYGSITAQVNLSKNLEIYGYGAILKSTTLHRYAGVLSAGDGVALKVQGVTFDMNKRQGIAIGGGSFDKNFSPAFVSCIDCTFLNVYNYAIALSGRSDGKAPTQVHIENCYFDAGSSDTLNEHILTNAVKNVTILNSVFLGNKVAYLSAETALIDQVYGNSTTLTEGYGMGIHAKYTTVSNVELVGQTITFRPYTSVHVGAVYESAKSIKVDNLSFTRNKNDNIVPIIFNGINPRLGFDEIYLNNIRLPDSAIYIVPFDDDNSKVSKMVITRLKIDSVNPTNGLLVVENHELSNLQFVDPPSPLPLNPVRLIGSAEIGQLNYS